MYCVFSQSNHYNHKVLHFDMFILIEEISSENSNRESDFCSEDPDEVANPNSGQDPPLKRTKAEREENRRRREVQMQEEESKRLRRALGQSASQQVSPLEEASFD